jgi:NAD(P)-dependent dehydrogenase (short-subunit alcohol dehydrogenase family)
MIDEYFELSGKVVVVTGGNGILGREFVETFVGCGSKVAVLDIIKSQKKERNIKQYKVDITSKTELTNALKRIVRELGNPTVLVNCAAVDVPPSYGKRITGLLEDDAAEKSFDRVMEVNVKGTILCSQVFGNYMAAVSNGGSIINISSIYGMVSPDQSIYKLRKEKSDFIKPISYCASKAAIPNITRYLATYFAPYNIRVNCLTLGGVLGDQNPEFIGNYSKKVPLGRMARKYEYNCAVAFLACDASSYMTGSNMVIDGGYTSW